MRSKLIGESLAEVKRISVLSSQHLQQSHGHRDSLKKGQNKQTYLISFSQGNLYFHNPTLENSAMATTKIHPFSFIPIIAHKRSWDSPFSQSSLHILR